MLTRLQVRNFAIIDTIEVEFGPGMTVLTGETGAGKSILVDALGLVLGERGSASLVRSGAKRAEFSADFDVSGHAAARKWLAEQAVDADDECLLRRVIGEDGRSRAFINGNNVPLQSLKELGEMLLDIHGQHFHQSLGRRSVQRDLLDHFGGLQELRVSTAEAFGKWKALQERLRQLEQAESDRAARLDLLSFQAQELDALDLAPDEFESLQSERQRLKMSGVLAEGVTRALQSIYDDDTANAQSLLASACHELDSGSEIDAELKEVQAMLKEAAIQVSEAADALHRYSDSLEVDPARRDWVEDRLDAIQAVARKHRVEACELIALKDRLHTQLDELQDAEATGARLAKDAADANANYLKQATLLSGEREKAATRFGARVTEAMQGLGMPDGMFEVSLLSLNEEEARASGLEEVEYLISANPGQVPMPLSKIASGGELSRMSLSIQVIGSDGSEIPTMVFDEVDSGVGGGVAEMVGRRLKGLSETRQVFCVTHLPQVASLADHHFRISKLSDGKSTQTEIAELGEGERVEELARMLGGVKITKRTREHAAEMLQTGTAAR
ncbi:MAG TPA: DNA repair protein RecN [Woeseiaceae bacterium]|nr:DNA repair protein RecN [Woeseiaceae bacterium]